jgi:membrane protease YdiL (CAAX protease family)
LLADRAPLTLKLKQQRRDAQIATLQTFGLSPVLPTASIIGLLSVAAGLAQELVFRGFLFTFLDNNYGPVVALLLSSVRNLR